MTIRILKIACMLAAVCCPHFAAAQAPAAQAPAAQAPAAQAPAAQTPAAQTPAAQTPAAKAPAAKSITTEPLNRDVARHQLINSRAKPGEVDLIFLGDSITQGWEKAGEEIWAKHFEPRKAMNAGIGGDRTQHVLWRLENGNIEGITPKLAVLMIGTNNSGANTSEEIAAGITAIVAKLRKELPETKVLVLGIFPRGADKDNPLRKINEGANAIVSKLADDKHVFYLDIGPKFLAEDGTLSKEIMPDLLHLSPKGYEIWATSIEDKVAELMGEKK